MIMKLKIISQDVRGAVEPMKKKLNILDKAVSIFKCTIMMNDEMMKLLCGVNVFKRPYLKHFQQLAVFLQNRMTNSLKKQEIIEHRSEDQCPLQDANNKWLVDLFKSDALSVQQLITNAENILVEVPCNILLT
jgi:hypothetical protein